MNRFWLSPVLPVRSFQKTPVALGFGIVASIQAISVAGIPVTVQKKSTGDSSGAGLARGATTTELSRSVRIVLVHGVGEMIEIHGVLISIEMTEITFANTGANGRALDQMQDILTAPRAHRAANAQAPGIANINEENRSHEMFPGKKRSVPTRKIKATASAIEQTHDL